MENVGAFCLTSIMLNNQILIFQYHISPNLHLSVYMFNYFYGLCQFNIYSSRLNIKKKLFSFHLYAWASHSQVKKRNVDIQNSFNCYLPGVLSSVSLL